MSFRVMPLPIEPFSHLFGLNDEQLAQHYACRMTVTEDPGTPCRVSLTDAPIGEEVILTHYCHQPCRTAFRASHAIYVRPKAQPANLEKGQLPEMFHSRLMSIRGFDHQDMMIAAEADEGHRIDPLVQSILANKQVEYLHFHFAKPGCFAAKAVRA